MEMIFAFNVLITVRTMRNLILEYQEVDETFPTEIKGCQGHCNNRTITY